MTEAVRPPSLCQIGMSTRNMPRTIRRFLEVFKFADGHGDLLWGPKLAALQALGQDDACATIWWLCSRQSLFQLELFQHTDPVPRSQPEDWTPADHGWVRFGFAVPDFDATLARLEAVGIETLAGPLVHKGVRRFVFRDPDMGCVIEVMEESADLPGGYRDRMFNVDPSVVYVAASVHDLDAVLKFFEGTMNLPRAAEDIIHDEDADAMWGLEGAKSRRAILQAGTMFIELREYQSPSPREWNRRVSDLGLSHIAVGYRDRRDFLRLASALQMDGYRFTRPVVDGINSTYAIGPEKLIVEIIGLSQERDHLVGFEPHKSALR
ncbi:hypothetical protein [Paraburkholderia sp. J12]|uniref:VOC family protein n=1 Tax=Paraburkholderia sp. J12 TaxID=2805432 RepID=UPI002ABE3A4E|nr:hypothetical protein [Paraburkholderia sp. J12]